MAYGLPPGKLGFKIGDVLVGLQDGTTDTPETISSTQNKLHTAGYFWNPDTLAFELFTGNSSGLAVSVANPGAPDLNVEIDDTGTGIVYVGKAAPGTAKSAAGWIIKRLVKTGLDLSVTLADGNGNADNVWNDRASLSY